MRATINKPGVILVVVFLLYWHCLGNPRRLGSSTHKSNTKETATAETVAEEEPQMAAKLRNRADNKWTSAAC
jgi:hypothetical protein